MAFVRGTGPAASAGSAASAAGTDRAFAIRDDFDINIHNVMRNTHSTLRVKLNDTVQQLITQVQGQHPGAKVSIDFSGLNLMREANKGQTLHEIGIGPGSTLDVNTEDVLKGGIIRV